MYPEYNWLPWKFNRLPQNYYVSQTDKQEIIKFLREKFNIVNKTDWNDITLEVRLYSILLEYLLI